MIRSPSNATWERVLAQALKGDAQHLIALLLVPVRTDNGGQPLPDDDGHAFYPLPEDPGLRERIVRTLMLIGISTRKSGRPAVSESDVALAGLWIKACQAAALAGSASGADYDEAGALIGLSGERLRKRLQAQKRSTKARSKAGG
jgi:hypothetical protein